MNSASDVALGLLIAYNHDPAEAHFMIGVFIIMSWPSFIYVISMLSIFHFHPHFQ